MMWNDWRSVFRLISGGTAIALLVVNLVTAFTTIRGATDPSALQLIEIYTRHIFIGVMVIGISIGIYIVTRAGDEPIVPPHVVELRPGASCPSFTPLAPLPVGWAAPRVGRAACASRSR